MEFFCSIKGHLSSPRCDLLENYVLIEDERGHWILNLKTKFSTRTGEQWYTMRPGETIKAWFIQRNASEIITLTEEFFEKYRKDHENEVTAKVTLVEDGFTEEDLDGRAIRTGRLSRRAWIVNEITEILHWSGTLAKLQNVITNAPKLWRVTTPKGEDSFLSRNQPQVLLYEDDYYTFIHLWDGTLEVYKTSS